MTMLSTAKLLGYEQQDINVSHGPKSIKLEHVIAPIDNQLFASEIDPSAQTVAINLQSSSALSIVAGLCSRARQLHGKSKLPNFVLVDTNSQRLGIDNDKVTVKTAGLVNMAGVITYGELPTPVAIDQINWLPRGLNGSLLSSGVRLDVWSNYDQPNDFSKKIDGYSTHPALHEPKTISLDQNLSFRNFKKIKKQVTNDDGFVIKPTNLYQGHGIVLYGNYRFNDVHAYDHYQRLAKFGINSLIQERVEPVDLFNSTPLSGLRWDMRYLAFEGNPIDFYTRVATPKRLCNIHQGALPLGKNVTLGLLDRRFRTDYSGILADIASEVSGHFRGLVGLDLTVNEEGKVAIYEINQSANVGGLPRVYSISYAEETTGDLDKRVISNLLEKISQKPRLIASTQSEKITIHYDRELSDLDMSLIDYSDQSSISLVQKTELFNKIAKLPPQLRTEYIGKFMELSFDLFMQEVANLGDIESLDQSRPVFDTSEVPERFAVELYALSNYASIAPFDSVFDNMISNIKSSLLLFGLDEADSAQFIDSYLISKLQPEQFDLIMSSRIKKTSLYNQLNLRSPEGIESRTNLELVFDVYSYVHKNYDPINTRELTELINFANLLDEDLVAKVLVDESTFSPSTINFLLCMVHICRLKHRSSAYDIIYDQLISGIDPTQKQQVIDYLQSFID